MKLCREMENVSKKIAVLNILPQIVSFYDTEKAKEVCNEIREFDGVYNREDCYSMVKKSSER